MELRTVATGVLVSSIRVIRAGIAILRAKGPATIRGSGVHAPKGRIGVVMTATRIPMTAGHGQIGLGTTGTIQTNGGGAGTVISGGDPTTVGA